MPRAKVIPLRIRKKKPNRLEANMEGTETTTLKKTRRRGRPPGSKNKRVKEPENNVITDAVAADATETVTNVKTEEAPAVTANATEKASKKRRGRPPGSKNKKAATETDAEQQKTTTRTKGASEKTTGNVVAVDGHPTLTVSPKRATKIPVQFKAPCPYLICDEPAHFEYLKNHRFTLQDGVAFRKLTSRSDPRKIRDESNLTITNYVELTNYENAQGKQGASDDAAIKFLLEHKK